MELDYTNLLTFANAKTSKGEALGYRTGIMYLAPADQSVPYGGRNVCPFASKGCSEACLYDAGRGRFDRIRNVRLARTLAFFANRKAFLGELRGELIKLENYCNRHDMKPCVRLNGTSDIPFYRMGIMEDFPFIQFYDYTKNIDTAIEFGEGQLPANYHITFSRAENNDMDCYRALEAGCNVAVVFDKKKTDPLPSRYMGHPVLNADKHDLRFLDGRGYISGLTLKGDNAMKKKARESGFAVKYDESMLEVEQELVA